MSTSTFGSGPRLRVMTFLGTAMLACSGVRWLRRTSSQTRLWSNESWSIRRLPDPVDARVADVGDQGPFGQEQEGRAGRPHPLEVAVGRGPAVDQGADLAVGLGDRLGRGARLGLHVVVRDVVAGHLAGQLADGVRRPCRRRP